MIPLRAVRLTALGLCACLVAFAGSMTYVGSERRSNFDAGAVSLERTWSHDLAVGVPASSIAPLRTRLRAQRPADQWWAPVWWTTDGQTLLVQLKRSTDSAYTAAMSGARAKAQLVVNDWDQEVGPDPGGVPAAAVAAGQTWPAQLSAASTPDQVAGLSLAWQAQLDTARTEMAVAQQQAQREADVAAAGGPSGLASTATADIAEASRDNLDPGDVPTLLTQLQTEMASGADLTQTSDLMYAAVEQLNQLLALNTQLNGEMRPLMLIADQAAAEGAPNSADMPAEYQALDQAFLNGTTYDQLSAVQADESTLQADVENALSADQCGHNVGSGKVITLNLTLQEMIDYDNGCVVNATPITTGRPGLETPTGNYTVFYKTSPFLMHSPWPPGSVDWYPDTWVTWVLEFADGYFLHDAYWENQSAFGPGSEDDVAQDYASHGCVHIPTAFMQWLYNWTPLGTPVIITN